MHKKECVDVEEKLTSATFGEMKPNITAFLGFLLVDVFELLVTALLPGLDGVNFLVVSCEAGSVNRV
jgi:hypothetical protein